MTSDYSTLDNISRHIQLEQKALSDVIVHFFVNFVCVCVCGGGLLNLALMKTKALYTGKDIIVSLSFLNSREGALKLEAPRSL